MDVQHFKIKIFAQEAGDSVLEESVLAFHGWIRDKVHSDQLLIDIADYSHVPFGPGIVLMGHESIYAVDVGPENRVGLLYTARAPVEGSNQDRLTLALRRTLKGCELLEQDKNIKGLKFSASEIRITVNDRLMAPNEAATFDALKADLQAVLEKFFQGAEFDMAYVQGDARDLFGVNVKAKAGSLAVAELLKAKA